MFLICGVAILAVARHVGATWVDQYQQDHAVFVDPEIVRQVEAVTRFMKTIRPDGDPTSGIFAFLDSSGLRGQTPVLLAAVATALGTSADRLGWATKMQYDVSRRIRRPVELSGSWWYVGDGLRRELPRQASELLLRYGVHQFERASPEPLKTIELDIGVTGEVKVTTMDHASPPPRAAADPTEFCKVAAQKAEALPMFFEPAAFFNTRMIAIEVHDAGERCGDACRQRLGHLVSRAVATWRTGCSRCRQASLQAIRVGDTVWLDEFVLDRLLVWILSNGVPDSLPEYDVLRTGRATEKGQRMAALTYSRLAPGAALRKDICDRPDIVRENSPAIRLLCGNSCEPPACVRLGLWIGGAGAPCSVAGRLACGDPDRGVALSTSAAKFHVARPGGSSVFVLGDGVDEVDLAAVVLHEVGHWFGLPHSTSDATAPAGMASVMSAAMSREPRWCITPDSLLHLDRLADRDYPDRLRTSHGLELAP